MENALSILLNKAGLDARALFAELGIPKGRGKYPELHSLGRSHLLAIAYRLGTGVEDLLGENPFEQDIVTRGLPYGLPQGISGFWGNVGLLLPGESVTRWYAISTEIESWLRDSVGSGDWVVMPTLDNRAVVFHPDRVKKIWFISEAADQARDWNFTKGAGSTGHCGAEFEALEAYWHHAVGLDSEAWGDVPDRLKASVEGLAEKMGDEGVDRAIEDTFIHFVDGSSETFEYDSTSQAKFYYFAELDALDRLLELTTSSGDDEVFPLSNIVMVDMPMRKITADLIVLKSQEE